MTQPRDTLIHIYRRPPQVGDVALCGHVREDSLEGHRLHTTSNQCIVCLDMAKSEGMTLLERTAVDPEGFWRS